MSDLWFEAYLEALPAGGRLLDLGCGSAEDAVALEALGFTAVATDRLGAALAEAREVVGTRSLLRVDHGRALPFIDGCFDGVLASLSLHYFSRETTRAVFAEVRRVLRPRGVLLFRVNATDDVHFGSLDGTEIEPGFRRYVEQGLGVGPQRLDGYGELKRFFDEDSVRDALEGRFVIETLRHMQVDRWRRPKQVWECLARAGVGARAPGGL